MTPISPLQVIVGSVPGGFGSYIFIVEGASHYDLYDKPEYVDQAVEKFKGFYKKNL